MSDQVIDDDIRERFAAPMRIVSGTVDPMAAVRHRIIRRRRRRVAISATGVGCALLGILCVVVLTMERNTSSGLKVVTNPTVADSIVTDPNGVEVLASPPLAARSNSAVLWTGSELVIWGGTIEGSAAAGRESGADDGAAYDPSGRTWRRLAPSPLPASTDAPVAAMTERGVVVVRGSATALWDPETNEWRRFDDAPAGCTRQCWRTGPVSDLSLVGDRLVSYSADAALNLQTGRWSELPQPPRHFERFAAVATGDQLVVIGGNSALARNTEALAFDTSTSTWQQLPTPPKLNQQAIAADWDGTRVIAVDYGMHAVAYDPSSNEWSVLPNVPARFSEGTPRLDAGDGVTTAFMVSAIAVLDHRGVWVPVPYGPTPEVSEAVSIETRASAQEHAIFAVGLHQQQLIVVALDPGRLARPPAQLQVGLAATTIPDGFEVTASSYDDRGLSQTVRIAISNGHGKTCDLASTYGVQPDSAAGDLVPITVGDTTTQWYRNTDGTRWQAATSTSDTIEITCNNAALAEQIARSTNLSSTAQ
jgi:Kelch motif protein